MYCMTHYVGLTNEDVIFAEIDAEMSEEYGYDDRDDDCGYCTTTQGFTTHTNSGRPAIYRYIVKSTGRVSALHTALHWIVYRFEILGITYTVYTRDDIASKAQRKREIRQRSVILPAKFEKKKQKNISDIGKIKKMYWYLKIEKLRQMKKTKKLRNLKSTKNSYIFISFSELVLSQGRRRKNTVLLLFAL